MRQNTNDEHIIQQSNAIAKTYGFDKKKTISIVFLRFVLIVKKKMFP